MAIKVDIKKKFRNFSLQVKFDSDSSRMGVLGASGSGKSMTLRCIAGIESPDEGKIVINGKTVFDSEKKINLKPQQRKIGYLFQNYALFPTMTVEENIGCGFRGEKRQRKDKIQRYIDRYRLDGLEKHYPAQLSGGQQQRVALARMMIGEPEAILLDEPFSALDSYLKDLLQKDMQEFLQGYAGDMLMVTHSREEAYKFCRELMLLKEGNTIISGETRKLFEQPVYLEAARLTGCKNFSGVEILDEHHIFALDWGIHLCTEKKIEPDTAYVGIRGHWIRPSDCEGENCIPIRVQETIETTFEHQYLVKNAKIKDASVLWWMRPKITGETERDKEVPSYLYLPPEKLMLLR